VGLRAANGENVCANDRDGRRKINRGSRVTINEIQTTANDLPKKRIEWSILKKKMEGRQRINADRNLMHSTPSHSSAFPKAVNNLSLCLEFPQKQSGNTNKNLNPVILRHGQSEKEEEAKMESDSSNPKTVSTDGRVGKRRREDNSDPRPTKRLRIEEAVCESTITSDLLVPAFRYRSHEKWTLD
jgi:hypothetical protein